MNTTRYFGKLGVKLAQKEKEWLPVYFKKLNLFCTLNKSSHGSVPSP